MDKQLLTESNSPLRFSVKSIKEEIKPQIQKNGMMIVRRVPSTICNEKNANGRTYKKNTMEKSIANNKANSLFEGRQLLCTGDDHPDTTFPKPIHSSHVVLDAYVEKVDGKDVLFNDWLILPTRAGKDLRGLIEAGVSIGTSIRGLGRQDESTGEITEYEFLGTDVVGNPSAGTFAPFGMVECVVESVSEEIAQNVTESLFEDEYSLLDESAAVSKGIFTGDSKKGRDLKIRNTLTLGLVDSEDFITDVNWKQWKSAKVKDTSSDTIKDEFVKRLIKKANFNFGKQVDFNSFVKKENPSFEDKVDWLLKNGAKLTKAGLRESYNNNSQESEQMFILENAIAGFKTKHQDTDNVSALVSDIVAIEKQVNFDDEAQVEMLEAFKIDVLGEVPEVTESVKVDIKAENSKDKDIINKYQRQLEAGKTIAAYIKTQNEELLNRVDVLESQKQAANKLVANLVEKTKKATEALQVEMSSIDEDKIALEESYRQVAIKIVEDLQAEAQEVIQEKEAQLEAAVQLGNIVGEHFLAMQQINDCLVERLRKQQENVKQTEETLTLEAKTGIKLNKESKKYNKHMMSTWKANK